MSNCWANGQVYFSYYPSPFTCMEVETRISFGCMVKYLCIYDLTQNRVPQQNELLLTNNEVIYNTHLFVEYGIMLVF